MEDNHTLFVSDEGVLTHNMNNVLKGCNFDTEVSEKLSKGVSKAEINTAEGIKNIINRKGYSVDEFAQLLHPDRVLTNNTAFKTTTGVDGISQSVGLPDRFYGTIEYKVNDVSKVSIPDWKANPEDYPYTGKGFTGSSDIVLPEYFQENRKFMNGDIFSIIDSCSGEVISKFKYNIKFGWINFN